MTAKKFVDITQSLMVPVNFPKESTMDFLRGMILLPNGLLLLRKSACPPTLNCIYCAYCWDLIDEWEITNEKNVLLLIEVQKQVDKILPCLWLSWGRTYLWKAAGVHHGLTERTPTEHDPTIFTRLLALSGLKDPTDFHGCSKSAYYNFTNTLQYEKNCSVFAPCYYCCIRRVCKLHELEYVPPCRWKELASYHKKNHVIHMIAIQHQKRMDDYVLPKRRKVM